MPRFADTTIGAPSVSSIRSRSDHWSEGNVARSRYVLRGAVDGARDSYSSSHIKSDAWRGPPLSNRCENDSGATAVEIGREARELASRMHVDLAQLRSSVDLQTQTDRALVMNADRHFQIAARMWYTLLQASDRRVPPHRSGDAASTTDAIVPSFHFVPMSTGPQLTLNIMESRAVSLSHQHRVEQRHHMPQQRRSSSASAQGAGQYQRWRDSDGVGVVEDDAMNLMERYRPADAWVEEAGGHDGTPRPQPRSSSVERPRWNVSSQPDPETVADPFPLSVEEPTKDWLVRKKLAKRRSASAEKSSSTGASGPHTQRRQLRFEGPDGTVSVGGPRPAHLSSGQHRSKEPVRCGAGNESVERVFGPHAYGRSMTGLWSQVSEEKVREATLPRTAPTFGNHHHRTASSRDVRDAASAQESKAYFPTLGDAGAKALGFVHDNSQANVSMSEDEIFARRHLHAMNLNIAPSRPGALDHPVWSGAVLCRVVNMIVRQFLPRQQLKEVPIHAPGGLSFDDVKANYVNALTRIRELHVPSGLDPIAPRLMYLDPKEILSGVSGCDMWSLLAKLIEVFILKTDRKAQANSISGAASSSVPVQIPMLGRYCDAYSARNMARLEESVCHFLYSINVSVEPVLHAIPADHEATQSLIPGPLNAPFLPDKRSRWHVRTTPLSSISLPSVFPYLTNGSMLCDVVSYVLDTDISTFRNPRVRVGCMTNIRNAQDELLKHYPSKISNMFLCDPVPVYEGDKAFVLLLLEDIMRLAANAPPRKHLPSVDQVPFLLPERWSAGAATASDLSSPHAASAAKPQHPSTTAVNESISAGMASASHAAQFVQPERQAFVSDPVQHTQLKWTLADLAMGHREGSVGSQGSQPSAGTPFTSSKANPPPKTIQLRAIGVTTTAPSSGRSIVPSDEVPEELHDEPPEPPALLPRHLEYLMAMHVEERELAYLGDWLVSKLGRAYRYAAADGSFEISARDIKLSHPSLIFSDGVVLSHLVRILSYHKCPQLDNIQSQPKTTAAKRNNIKKVLEYLRTERKTLVDYVFLEDVLVTGDLRAVVLVLRALRAAYKNHISSVK